MTQEQISALVKKQRAYYNTGATLNVDFRIEMLKKLYASVKKHQDDITDALTADLGKSEYEGFMCEAGLVLTELSYLIRKTRKFAAERTVPTPLPQFASHSYVKPSLELSVSADDRAAGRCHCSRKYGGCQAQCLFSRYFCRDRNDS